jgi:hypothetical protein
MGWRVSQPSAAALRAKAEGVTPRELGLEKREADYGTLIRPKVCKKRFTMPLNTDKIDDAALALLYLTLHDSCRAWKGFDWGVLGRRTRRA